MSKRTSTETVSTHLSPKRQKSDEDDDAAFETNSMNTDAASDYEAASETNSMNTDCAHTEASDAASDYEALTTEDDALATIENKHDDYTIAWICSSRLELKALEAMLDERHNAVPIKDSDKNTYTPGWIHQHNVVIARLYDSGGTAAEDVANLKLSFPKVVAALLIGIGGCLPKHGQDVPRRCDRRDPKHAMQAGGYERHQQPPSRRQA